MGETRFTFDRFLAEPIANIPVNEIQELLYEITSGISSFGDGNGEWSSWFRYCVPGLIRRSHESYAFTPLLEPTISAFMNVFWTPDTAPMEAGVRDDLVRTLGTCIMKRELWVDAQTPRLGTALGIRGGSTSVVFWGQSSGDFSASMFFALRYFPVHAFPSWIDSLLAIDHPAWRARLLVWLWGAASVLRSPTSRASDLERCQPSVSWQDSHCLGPREREDDPFLPEIRTRAFLDHMRKRLEGTLADFTFDGMPEVAETMASLGVVDSVFDAIF